MRTKTSKRIKEKFNRKYENIGEKSPYRDYLENNEKQTGLIDNGDEPAEANPDVLAESDGLWFVSSDDLSEADETKLAAIKSLWASLTPTQREILHLVGYEGKTFENAAAILGVKKGTIQKTVERIRYRVAETLRENGHGDVLQNEGC